LTPDQFNRIAKALADPRRFQILERIAACGDAPCQELCAEFPVTQPTMSHHLRELSSAGLVEARREGQFAHYRFRRDVLDEYIEAVQAKLVPAARAARTRVAASSSAVTTRRS
jgi:ArsR family transcriptional regulator, arsenate/arsenite/antimonite-responsive transcriptional repressor